MQLAYTLIKLKLSSPRVRLRDGRLLARHSVYGNLHTVPLDDALRLVESGIAKLLRRQRLHELRADVARLPGG